jgi:hypothetical protein
MEKFVERVTLNEAFRQALIASPTEILSQSGLSNDEIEAVRNDQAWEWLRQDWLSE